MLNKVHAVKHDARGQLFVKLPSHCDTVPSALSVAKLVNPRMVRQGKVVLSVLNYQCLQAEP